MAPDTDGRALLISKSSKVEGLGFKQTSEEIQMNKLSVMFMAMAAVSCATFGQGNDGIATSIKSQYDKLSGTGAVQVATSDVIRVFGSQEVLDMCIANGWKASPIAKGLQGKKVAYMMTSVAHQLPDSERWDFVKVIADGYNKATAVYFMACVNMTLPEDVSYVFAINDGSETNVISNAGIRQYCVAKSIRDNKVTKTTTVSITDLVDFLLLGGPVKSAADVEWAKTKIKTMAVPSLKRSLRVKGKSFVAKDNVNPIEVEMKPVVDALNAPKLQGLEAALRGIGVEIADVERAPAIWDAIIAEKTAIFYGDKPAHPTQDGGIMLLLGPDGYNAWVKEFNEGK
jgi:hypothetical protein